ACRQSAQDGNLQYLRGREETMTEPVSVSGSQANRSGYIAVETRGLVLAALLSALAGMVDALGYLHLSGLLVSFMIGSSTQLAAALGQGDLAEAGTIAALMGLFVAGSAAGQVLAGFTGRRHMPWVLVGVAVLLAVAATLATAAEPIVFAMGTLNAAM